MQGRTFLGVDVGTSSSKGVLVGADGTILASTSRSHSVSQPAPGHFEMDAQIWWEEFTSITEELTRSHPTPVTAVGVSGMGPCVLIADNDGEPIRPAILYGVDTRSTEEVAELSAKLAPEELLDRCGSLLSSQSAGPKLLWLARNEPENYSRARHFFMPATYLVHRLTGEYVLDMHSASQSTPLFDRTELDWIDDAWNAIGPGIEQPRLEWAGAEAGRTIAALPGIPKGTPVTVGTIDAWTEAESAGALQPQDLFLMYGTTLFMIASGRTPASHESMWGTVSLEPGTWNLAAGMATSGAITAWLKNLAGDRSYEELTSLAADSPPGANGLILLPYFAGERTPLNDPDARGVIAGLTLNHSMGDLYRAALEGTAFGIRHNLEVMRESGIQVSRVVAVGGGVTGGTWTQIVSDVTGLEQVIPSITIGASYGAAHLAATMVGHEHSIRDWNPPSTIVRPDPSRRAIYDELYPLYRDLYPATQPIAHRLADIQRRP